MKNSRFTNGWDDVLFYTTCFDNKKLGIEIDNRYIENDVKQQDKFMNISDSS